MADEIEKLPGVGEKNAEKLRSAGFNSYMALAATSAAELNEAGVAGEDTANKIINAARAKLKMGFETATEALKRRQLIGKITTGSKSLDGLLGGGVETQAITEAHGAFGCLTGDTKITLSDGQLLPIGNLARGLSAGVYPVNVPILAQNGNSIVKTDAVSLHVYNCENVLRVNLHNGMSVSVTTNHPLMTPSGWKEASNLSLQDKIKIVHDSVFTNNYVKLDTALRKRVENTRHIDLPIELTPELAEIVAYILGEGWKEIGGDRGITRVCFTNTNKEMLDKFRELVSAVFKIEANIRYKRTDITAYAIDSVIACEFLEQFHGLYFNAKEKYIPDQIFSSPKEVIVRFLAALYDCEGSVKLDNIKERERVISWTTLKGEKSNVYRLPSYGRDIDLRSSSRRLLEGVQILLTKLGIDNWINQDVTKRDGKEFVGYKVHISNKDGIETFYKEIGIRTIRLRDKIEKAIESYKRNAASRLADFVGIKSIDIVKTSDGKVYDLEVPGLHNFLANNILSHNSGKSQLAHQLAVTVQLPVEKGGLGGKAVFIDTEQSLPYDEKILIQTESGIKPVKIGEIVEESLKTGHTKIGDTISSPNNPKNLKCLSFDPDDNKIKPFPITGFIKHKEQEVFLVKLASGRKVKVTKHHNFFSIMPDGTLGPIATSKLEVGDKISVASNLPIDSFITDLDLSEILIGENLHVRGKVLKPYLLELKEELKTIAVSRNGNSNRAYNWINRSELPLDVFNSIKHKLKKEDYCNLRIGGWSRNNTIPLVIELDSDFMKFVGLYVAEGSCVCKKYSEDSVANLVIITNTDENIRKGVIEFGEKLGVRFRISKNDIVTSSRPFALLIKKLNLGDNAYEKKAPEFLLSAGKDSISSFLDGYIAGDGSLNGITGTTNCETVSQFLAEDLMNSTQALEIPARNSTVLRYKDSDRKELNTFNIHWQTIKGVDSRLEEFPNKNLEIGSILISLRKREGITQVELSKRSGINSSVINHIESGHIKNVRKENLKIILSSFKVQDIVKENLVKLIEGDIWFDSVESIEKVSFEPVYDIEVLPEGRPVQNFIGGYGGIILHNTFRPERIQDMAAALGLDTETVLANILVARAYNSDHQILLVEKAEEIIQSEGVKLIIVDSLTANFRSDYTGRGQLADRQQTLNRHLHKLQRLADVYNLAIYITNQVMSRPDVMFGDPTAPIGGHVLGHQATYRLYLRKSKGEKRIGKLIDSPNLPEAETVFKVGKDGVRDDEDADKE